MKHNTGTFNSPNGTTIFHQSWMPVINPKAVLILVHGISEHSGRYMNLVNHLVPQGYIICGLDHQGHGQSGGHRKYVHAFGDYIDTLEVFSAKVRAEHAGLPVFLLGHSMGGLMALQYLLEHQDEFSGAVISAPAIKLSGNIPPLTLWLGKLAAILLPKLGLIPIKPEGVSRDKSVVKAYLDDPLVLKGKTSARLAAEILKTMQHVLSHAQQITLPMLVVQGDADVIVDPEGAQLLCDAVSCEDVTLKVYSGLYHEVFNEPEHQEVLSDVSDWLNAQLLRGQ